EQSLGLPERHRSDELAGVALRVPRSARVIPPAARFRIPIVEDALHHSGIEQQPLDAHPVVRAPDIRRGPVHDELASFDSDDGVSCGALRLRDERQSQHDKQAKISHVGGPRPLYFNPSATIRNRSMSFAVLKSAGETRICVPFSRTLTW